MALRLINYWKGAPFTGLVQEFYPDGKLEVEYPYFEGVAQGAHREWYPSGQLKSSLCRWQAFAHGFGCGWDEAGRLIRQHLYEIDRMVAERKWDDKGRLIRDWRIGPDESNYAAWWSCRVAWGPFAPPISAILDDFSLAAWWAEFGDADAEALARFELSRKREPIPVANWDLGTKDKRHVDAAELKLNDEQFICREGKPFTGYAMTFSREESPMIEMPYHKGVTQGLSREGYPTGQLKRTARCWHGMLHEYEQHWSEQGHVLCEKVNELGITIRENQWDDSGKPRKDWRISQTHGDFAALQEQRMRYGPFAPFVGVRLP